MAFSASLRRVLCRSSSSSTPLTFAPLSSPVRFNSSLVPKTKLFVSVIASLGPEMDQYRKFANLMVAGIFSAGLSRLTTDEKLQEAFSPFGQLLEAKVITDRASGRSKGFGFVRYATEEEATKAREGMNAKFLDGWVIFVDPAKPREPKPPPPPEPNPSEAGFRVNKTIGWCG